MATRRQEIKTVALEILKSSPTGIHYADLVRRIQERCPHIALNTIRDSVWNLEARYPNDVCKPAKGLLLHLDFRKQDQKGNSTKGFISHI